jgi:Zn finger protein HypA/HybF involved in hydrogenase expression
MKICPNCKSEVEDNFELCWNCQYSFTDEQVLTDKEFKVVCPACNTEIDPDLQFCPNCKFDLSAVVEVDQHGVAEQVKQINCLRCQIPMSFNGNVRFHEGTRMGAFGDLFELFTNRESFDLYFCPKCGKVEFFLPDLANLG